MDAEAIRELINHLVMSNTNMALGNTDNYPIILPNGYKLVDLEQYADQPARFRCNFSTTVFDDFVLYVKDKAAVNLMVTVQPDEMTAKAVFDFGTPDSPSWREHTAFLSLERSTPLEALLMKNELAITQDSLIDFLEDYAEHVTFYDTIGGGGIPLSFGESITAIRNIRVTASSKADNQVGDFANAQSKYDKIEVEALGGTLPGGFLFACEPYDNFPHQQVSPCQLRMVASKDGPPLFKIRIQFKSKLDRESVEAFRSEIQTALAMDGVYCGRFS